MFVIRKDGKYVSHHDTEMEALRQLQQVQPHSWDYAFKFAGYTLKQEKIAHINTNPVGANNE
jgi:hypothetical protein